MDRSFLKASKRNVQEGMQENGGGKSFSEGAGFFLLWGREEKR